MIMNLWTALLHTNEVLVTSLVAWLIAQLLKTIVFLIIHGKLDIERLVGAGGWPSAHTALVVSLATSIGLHEGVDSNLFALSVIFACIVMYDAAGVRRAAGNQARVLNEILEELQERRTFSEIKLKELLGHTPVEVLSGALLGIVIAYLVYI